MNAKDSITVLPGIGPKKAQLLGGMGIETVEDLYLLYPRTYEDRRDITPVSEMEHGKKCLVRARVRQIRRNGFGKNQNVYMTCEDDSGSFEAIFFHSPYIVSSVKTGSLYDFYGTCDTGYGKVRMMHPQFHPADDSKRGIIPVYPLTKGISGREMIKYQKIVSEAENCITDYLPEQVRERNNICGLEYAIKNIHFPESRQKLAEARYRIVFDELLTVQLGIAMMRAGRSISEKAVVFSEAADEGEYIDSMPYNLTNAQRRAVSDIIEDMESDSVMNRLLQGDVGSGKTAVAEIALFKAAKSGYQAVMMAPTEILARQHYEGIKESFDRFGINTVFLGGKLKESEKREVLAQLKDGSADVLIGTHAVISDSVEFKNLGLVITDEQHRFGVNQRALLGSKGEHPDRIVMTATPIPRTLAVVLYGDLDISVIDELPAGRKPVKTTALTTQQREQAYSFLEEELKKGRQGYVVTPIIEDNEQMDVLSVTAAFDMLSERFPGYTVRMLHGEMKSQEKDDIFREFREGNIDILVSTVVIEVGINVPNATVMIIENAERFGLAQLHQLRGRVGRGSHSSTCFIITGGGSETAAERAAIMEKSNDGFYIAEEDLKLRGPGDIFGTRQHGIPDMKMADMARHGDILRKAGKEAALLIGNYDYFMSSECDALRERISKTFGQDMTFNL